MMRIAFVHPAVATIGGAEYVAVWLCSELGRRGHTVTLFTSRYSDKLFGAREGQAFSIEETSGLGYENVSAASIFAQGRQLARRSTNFDLIVAHNWPAYPSVALARFLNKSSPSTIWYCEEPQRALYSHVCYRPEFRTSDLTLKTRAERSFLRLVDRTVVRSFDLILANSRFTAGWLEQIFGAGLELRPCPLGVPSPIEGRRERVQGRRILTVSRLYPVKNVATVLRAVKLLVAHHGMTDVNYTIVGDGPELDRLRALADSLGLGRVVAFLGLTEKESVWSLYQQSTVFVSVPYDEPFGLTFVEAAANGVASIAPDHGGPAELVVDGKTGLLVDPSDPDAIADCMAQMVQDSSLARKMGELAFRRYSEHYTIEKFADRFERALGTVTV